MHTLFTLKKWGYFGCIFFKKKIVKLKRVEMWDTNNASF
jgi:hypothetical protein